MCTDIVLYSVIFFCTLLFSFGDLTPLDDVIERHYANYKYYLNHGEEAIGDHGGNVKRDASVSLVGTFQTIRILRDESQIASSTSDFQACDEPGKVVLLDDPMDRRYICKPNDVMDPLLLGYVKYGVLPAALAVIENLFQVNRSSGVFKYDPSYFSTNGKCINGHTIPMNQVNGTGIAATDFVLFTTIRPRLFNESSALADTKGKSYVVTGSPCQFTLLKDGHLGRPLAGWLNFNSGSGMLKNIDIMDTYFYRYVTRLTVQALLQTLGISMDLVPHFKSPSGDYYYQPLITSPPMLATPRVLLYARDHYGCQSLLGVPLDDTLSRLTYTPLFLSKKAVGNEILSPSQLNFGPPVLSALTIAFIEDSGWYRSNYSFAEPLHWGHQQGCSFVTARCSPSSWSSPGYWCSSTFKLGCTADRSAFGYCNLKKFDFVLPQLLQFPSLQPNEAGADPLYGNCPFYTPIKASFCTNTHNPFRIGDPLGVGEMFSDSSACFDIQTNSSDVACYPTRCNSALKLEVNVAGNWLLCPDMQKVVVNVGSTTVTINCPVSNSFCAKFQYPLNFIYDTNMDVASHPPPNDTTPSPTILPPPPPSAPAPQVFNFSGNAKWYFTDYEACFWVVICVLSALVFSIIGGIVYHFCTRDPVEKEKKELKDILKTTKKTDEYLEMSTVVKKISPQKDNKPKTSTPEVSISVATSSSDITSVSAAVSQNSQPAIPLSQVSSSEIVYIKNDAYTGTNNNNNNEDDQDESV